MNKRSATAFLVITAFQISAFAAKPVTYCERSCDLILSIPEATEDWRMSEYQKCVAECECEAIFTIPEVTDEWRQHEFNQCLAESK